MSRVWEDQNDNRERFMLLWKGRVPVRQMATRLNISLSTIYEVRTRLGLKRANSPAEAARWKRRYG